MTVMIAKAKAAVLLPKITTPSILICSDQVIRCNGEIREKPESEAQARQFLETYRTYPPECINGVVVYNTATGTVLFTSSSSSSSL
jgi:septum formation protein